MSELGPLRVVTELALFVIEKLLFRNVKMNGTLYHSDEPFDNGRYSSRLLSLLCCDIGFDVQRLPPG